ncbi:CcdB family protein [Mesorhizobium intechi]|uniref:CcdB family protein n=1 Tax=Mesorhizobium intechi TaxID=537601 RepID=UPI001FE89206|nr:CcdB family protein [Mesorhizobium intechi]
MPPDTAPVPGRRLNPTFAINGKDHVMVTEFLSASTASELQSLEGNLSRHHDDIVGALGMLLQGFRVKATVTPPSQPAVFACQALIASSNTFSPGMPFSMVSSARRPVL